METTLYKREPDPDNQAAAIIETVEKLTATIRGVKKGKRVEIQKAGPIGTMDPGGAPPTFYIRELFLSVLRDAAAEAYPGEDTDAAIAQFMETDEGAKLYRQYADADPEQTVAEWVAQRSETAKKRKAYAVHAGAGTAGEALSAIAKRLRPDDFAAGLALAQQKHPELVADYMSERR